MKIYLKSSEKSKVEVSSVPNLFAYGFINNFLIDGQYEDLRKDYFINNLSSRQASKVMKDIKSLFRENKNLDILTMESNEGEIKKFVL